MGRSAEDLIAREHGTFAGVKQEYGSFEGQTNPCTAGDMLVVLPRWKVP